MRLDTDRKLLKPKTPIDDPDWRLREKKDLNIHRGVIEWSALDAYRSITEMAERIREGVRTEFRPRWCRGFGFGTIPHFSEAPGDVSRICEHLDAHNRPPTASAEQCRALTRGAGTTAIYLDQGAAVRAFCRCKGRDVFDCRPRPSLRPLRSAEFEVT